MALRNETYIGIWGTEVTSWMLNEPGNICHCACRSCRLVIIIVILLSNLFTYQPVLQPTQVFPVSMLFLMKYITGNCLPLHRYHSNWNGF